MYNMIEKKIKEIYISAFENIDERVKYLILIGTKIISNNLEKRNIRINEKRMIDEFLYLKYYSGNEEYYFLNFFLPIILSFRSFANYTDLAIDLADKLSRFFGCEQKKNQYILDIYCYDYLVRYFLVKNKINIEEIMDELKNQVIEFNPYSDDKKRNVRFQIDKIKYINAIHKIIDQYKCDNEDYDITGILLLDVFMDEYIKNYGNGNNHVVGEFKTVIEYEENISLSDIELEKKKLMKNDVGIKSIRNCFSKIFEFSNDGYEIQKSDRILNENESDTKIEIDSIKSDKSLINSMSEYLIKVRNFELQTKDYTVKSNPRYLVEVKTGDVVSDPILNNIKVVSKNIIDEHYIVEVISKTGKYVFSFNK